VFLQPQKYAKLRVLLILSVKVFNHLTWLLTALVILYAPNLLKFQKSKRA